MQSKSELPIQIQITSPFILLDRSFAALLADIPGLACWEEPPASDEGLAPSPHLLLYMLEAPANLKPFEALRKRLPEQPIVLFTFEWSTAQTRAALQAGAAGCLTADMQVDAFAAALRQAARGEIALPASLQQALILELSKREKPTQKRTTALSSRERDVLALLVKGLSNKEIAQHLYISVRTVENHLARLYGKLEVNSRTEAAVLAIHLGWVESD